MEAQLRRPIQPFQISGGPEWGDSVHYDIAAKPDTPVNQSDWRVMLQQLLQDRFQLQLHRETKELPIYALVLAHKDGKLGPGITESKEGACTLSDPSKPFPLPEPGKPLPLGCGNVFMGRDPTTPPGYQELRALRVSIARIIPILSQRVGRAVIDKTGLAGTYDIVVNFTPDENQLAGMAAPGVPPPQVSSDASGPSLFTALQEQLGLKLESQKGPVEIFVIDRAEKPSEN